MKIRENGIVRDATPEEEAEYERQRREIEEELRNRQPTAEERLDAQVTYTAMMTDTLLPEEE